MGLTVDLQSVSYSVLVSQSLTLYSSFMPPEQAAGKIDGLRRGGHSPPGNRAPLQANVSDDNAARAFGVPLGCVRRRIRTLQSPRLRYKKCSLRGGSSCASIPFLSSCPAQPSIMSIQPSELSAGMNRRLLAILQLSSKLTSEICSGPLKCSDCHFLTLVGGKFELCLFSHSQGHHSVRASKFHSWKQDDSSCQRLRWFMPISYDGNICCILRARA